MLPNTTLDNNQDLVQLCTAVLADASVQVAGRKHEPMDGSTLAWHIGVSIVLVLLAGIFSGLTLGLMGLDTINLQVLSQAGTPEEQEQAPKVLKLLSSGRHTILVVLLLGNTLVNTSLPIFLDSIIGGGVYAILGATALELVFGEVIPQAICSKYGLAIGASFAPLVRAFVILMYPIAKPIAMILDWAFGSHDDGVTYRKAELKAFVSLGVEDQLVEEELHILGSVLEFSTKTVGTIMTPISDVYQLPSDRIADADLVAEVLRKGHTRIPVYNASHPGSYVGCLLIRALIDYDPSDPKPVSALVSQVLPQCAPDLSLVEALNYFQTGRSHLLLVSTKPGRQEGAVGITTLEDVVEELIGKEIIDETDQYVDIHSRIPVIRPRHQGEHPGLRRIFEGRINSSRRRRAAIKSQHHLPSHLIEPAAPPPSLTASLIDHPTNDSNV